MKAVCTALAVLSLLVAASCTGSKPLAKKAAKLDAGGMYAEAADMYLQSAIRNANNVDAKIGLKKTGQMLLNDKLSAFFKAFSMGEDKESAVNAFLDAQQYQQRVQRAGVVLEIPASYATDFKQVKSEYLLQLYDKGQEQLGQKDYPGAEATFAKIGQLEPGYKDASSLQNVAFLEPLYISGKAAMAAGQYRKAYTDLGRVTARNAAYKDAAALQKQCVEKGRYPIAVMPFTTTTAAAAGTKSAQAATMQALVTSALTNLNDPFITVVDRDNIQKILDEQKLGMSGVVDESSAVSAGKLLGAQAVLMGSLISYQEDNGRLRQSTKEGYEGYQVKELNAETGQEQYVTKYKPVNYVESYRENKAVISFSYKLVSLETGQVLMSKVVDRDAADHAWYATYDGNGQALLPKLNGGVDTRNSARRDLAALLAAPRNVKTAADLGNDLLRSTSSAVAASIQTDLAGKLP